MNINNNINNKELEDKMKIAIFLGAGASAAEHCPIQSQLFVEYFKSLTQKDYKSEMNIELYV